MKTIISILSLVLLGSTSSFAQSNIVEKYGKLQVKGNYLTSENGDTVQLRGMALFWSQWMDKYYNEPLVKCLKDDWKATVVRASMGAEMGGYLDSPEAEKAKVMTVVDACIKHGLYVIIDFHSHEAHKHQEQARKFFGEMAQKYSKYPNVIYEIYNEPLQGDTWRDSIKPYSKAVIAEIRKYDALNLIVCGTRQWSQMVSEAAADPINDVNVAYSLHYYAGTHKKWLREEAKKALEKGICLFVTEMGTCDASGNSTFSPEESKVWWEFLDKHKISWCNWSIADKAETASAIAPGASDTGQWTDDMLTASGKLVKNEMLLKNGPLLVKSNSKKKK